MSNDNIIQFPTKHKGEPIKGVTAVDALRICVDHTFDGDYIDEENYNKLMITLDMFEDMYERIEKIREDLESD